MFDDLCTISGLSSHAKCYALAYRGECYRVKDKWEKQYATLKKPLLFLPGDASAIASRGQTYQVMERYEEALADFDRAVALDQKLDWAIASRGETYRLIGAL